MFAAEIKAKDSKKDVKCGGDCQLVNSVCSWLFTRATLC